MATPLLTTANYKAYLQDTQFSIGDIDTPTTVTETWHITSKETLFKALAPESATPSDGHYGSLATERVIPYIQQLYTDWVAGTGAVARSPVMTVGGHMDSLESARCIGTDIRKNKDGSLTATSTFVTRYKAYPTTLGTTLKNIFPPIVEYTATVREMETFRSGNFTAPPANSDKSSSNIGGDKVSSNGRQGVPTPVAGVRIRVRRVFDCKLTGVSLSATAYYLQGHVGKRNSATFLGMGAGECVFEGFNIAKLEGTFYEIVADFDWDQYYGHVQVPELAADGLPKTDGSGLNYSDVRWERIKRTTVDFNSVIFWYNTLGTANADMKQVAETGAY